MKVKKLLALLMSVLMLMSIFSVPTYATEENTATATVDFTAQAFNGFLFAPQFDVEVAGNLAESYGYTDSVTTGVSALDVLVKAHKICFEDAFTSETTADYLVVSDQGIISLAFGMDASASGFTVNEKCPNNGVLSNEGYYTGYNINQAAVVNNDFIEFYLYRDTSYWMDMYSRLECTKLNASILPEGTKADGNTVSAGDTMELEVKGYPIGWYGFNTQEFIAQQTENIADAMLAMVDISTGTITDLNITTDENGKATIQVPTDWAGRTYYITAYMPDEEIEENYASPLIMTLAKITVKEVPTEITIKCVEGKSIDGKLIGKSGDTFRFAAYDQNNEETPVTWKTQYFGTIDENGVLTAGNLYAGGSSNAWITATSTIDTSVIKEQSFSITGYLMSSYQKNKTEYLSTDGQSVKTTSVNGGYNGYNVWSYDIPEGVAEPNGTIGNSSSAKFNIYRPGTFTVSFKLDFDETMTDTATVNVKGVAVEDSEGNLGKTYIEMSEAAPNPTTQLTAYVADGLTVSGWSSSDENVATVDENGLVTAAGVGSAIISATDSDNTKGGIKVIVTDAETPYFESVDFNTLVSSTPRITLKNWNSTYFKPATFTYEGLAVSGAAGKYIEFNANTIYNTEKYTAVATYTDSNGAARNVEINSSAVTRLDNLPYGETAITVVLTDKADGQNTTIYTFKVTRPRDTAKTIASNGIVLVPDGRSLLSTNYNGKAEGTMFRADSEGTLAQYINVTSGHKYYRTYALEGVEAFSLTLKSSTEFAHIRYSTDDGENWNEVTQGQGNTGKIAFGQKEENTNSEVKVIIQILDDSTYNANIEAEKGGFADSTPDVYTVWVEQIPVSDNGVDILTAATDSGEWYPEFSSKITSYRIVIENNAQAPVLTYTAADGATVKIGSAAQTPDESGKYTLTLTNAAQSITVTSADEKFSKTYSVGYTAKSAAAVPDRVLDYLVINSQYTNSGQYGLLPETTLGNTGIKSLGNFGGYITYYYDEPLTDNPNNKYGVDFYVYGNANVDNSTGTGLSFMEPGQVWVSEDGESWYALAGSEHYEESTIWDYSITYSKNSVGKTSWTDNQGNSDNGTQVGVWPLAVNYPLNKLLATDTITLNGILLSSADGTVAGNGTAAAYAGAVRFGYADALPNGTIGEDTNPYTENPKYANPNSGFDLAWAVDENGVPVDVSDKEFHYVKVVTASNIWAGGNNEKSTEISKVVRATAQGSEVGTTTAPKGVTISDGASTKVVNFTENQQVYSVELDDMKYVSLTVDGAEETDNIYINNQRIASGEAADGIKVTKEKGETLVRVIVQNGDKEPVICLLKLTSNATESDEIIEAIKVDAIGNIREAATTDGINYSLTVGHRVSSIEITPIVAPENTYTVNSASAKESYTLEYGTNTFEITSKDVNGKTQTVTLTVTREEAPVASGNSIVVSFTLYGDELHGESEVHTYKKNRSQLPQWISKKTYTVPAESMVLDVFETALTEAKKTWTNDGGNYISEIDGLAEFDNGTLSGWLYLLNGQYPTRGIAEQALKNGDVIVFHYTDDYTTEKGMEEYTPVPSGRSTTSKKETEEKTEETPATSVSFADVEKGSWYESAVSFVVNKNLFKGVSESNFAPNNNMTRAMLVTVLYRLENTEIKSEKSAFIDVPAGEWYTDAVAWATENNIVAGMSETNFAPNDNMTREQLALIMYRYAKYKNYATGSLSDLSEFTDLSDISDWAEEAVKWANAAGIVNGISDTMLSPKGTATRAQVAAIFMRFCENVAK